MTSTPAPANDLPEPTSSPFLYPVALNVRGRRCVVIGGGIVGVRKSVALLGAGAEVTVVAPEASPALLVLANDGHVTHLEEAFLVIAATDRSEVNLAVADAARARGVLLNLAADTDDAEDGDFAAMASVRRGDLVLGVTTGGAGPALTARIKQELETHYGLHWERYVALLGAMRSVAKRDIPDPEQRAKALRRLAASDTVRTCFTDGSGDPYKEAMQCLFP
jgi:precorrin-2 dehydrogenase/sirohydrochlorin ferrochelatase